MDQRNTISGMLELLTRPAFTVIGGAIDYVNQAAANLLIDAGTPISALLATGFEEYANLSGGCLYLTVSIHGLRTGASVSRENGTDIFILDEQNAAPQLQALALAARSLREPLSGAMLAAGRLSAAADADPDFKKDAALLNQRLHQLLRVIGNMSDAQRYTQQQSKPLELRDAAAVFQEIFDKATELAGKAGIHIRYQGPDVSIFCPLDTEKIERAIYNMISNSIKSTSDTGQLDARLLHKNGRLILTVRDYGHGISNELLGAVHSRYLRQPGLEDFSSGIGLGMVMIRAAAAAHGGTVLIDQPADGGTRITVTFKVLPTKEFSVRHHHLRVDYTGERDHGLVELSEHLPWELYKQ